MMTRRSFAASLVAAAADKRLNIGIGTYTYHNLTIGAMTRPKLARRDDLTLARR